MSSLRPASTFQSDSGHLCFGALHNIYHGASTPIQEGFPEPPADSIRSETLKSQAAAYNISAKRGVWNVYPLVSTSDVQSVVGYFLAHEAIDARPELDKILRIAPSPYEYDSDEDGQSRWNDENSRSAGILLINRYDWGSTDCRSLEELYGSEDQTGPVEVPYEDLGSAIGLVDHAHAQEVASRWKHLPTNSIRSLSIEGTGVYLWLKHHEYEFGRFSFDEEKKSAQSFLFFSTNTDFTQTTFLSPSSNEVQPLRTSETAQEKFNRRLLEGWDFSGLKKVRETYLASIDGRMKRIFEPPPSSQLVGPYSRVQHLLTQEDLHFFRIHRPSYEAKCKQADSKPGQPSIPPNLEALPVSDAWKDRILELVNELIMSWLQHDLLPTFERIRSPESIADLLFPNHEHPKSLDGICLGHFVQVEEQCLDVNSAVEAKASSFIQAYYGSDFDAANVAGIVRVAAYLVNEVFELASQRSRDAERMAIVPDVVRLCVLQDEELKGKFEYSRVLWEGTEST